MIFPAFALLFSYSQYRQKRSAVLTFFFANFLRIYEDLERLEELINEFFEITRFSLTHLELSTVSLKRMLEQIMYEFSPMLAQKQMSCQMDLQMKIFFLIL